MKQLKDYLHLLIGCKIIVDKSNYWFVHEFIIHKGDMVDLTPLLLSRIDINGKDVVIKPILRQLSSMTKDEWNEFEVIITKDYSKMITIDSISKEGEWTRIKHAFEAERYLLSKHFDLFNLISEGLAIDATTLNPTPKNTPITFINSTK